MKRRSAREGPAKTRNSSGATQTRQRRLNAGVGRMRPRPVGPRRERGSGRGGDGRRGAAEGAAVAVGVPPYAETQEYVSKVTALYELYLRALGRKQVPERPAL